MKKSLILLLLTGTLWSCNNPRHAENKDVADTSEAKNHQHGQASEKLVMNSGVKWEVDAGTSNNVRNLQEILKKFDSGSDRSLVAYKKTHEDLQHGIDKMVIECKMNGPAHEALHKWLEPLIAQVAELKQASTVPDAASALKAIDAQANLFNQYFEL